MNVSIHSNLSEFQSMLDRYMAATSALPEDVLEKKGRDLGIRLYRGFRFVRWRSKSLAYREFRARVRAGRGTRVRQRFISERWAADVPLTQKVTKRGQRSGRDAKSTYPTSLWQRLVAQELLRRKAGGGALAASFLWFRRRSNQARGTFFVRNKTGQPLGYVDRGTGFFRIVGLTEGLAKVANRYGIVATALSEATADMSTYVQRKEREAFRQAFGGAAV